MTYGGDIRDMKKKIYVAIMTLALACAMVGCGKKDNNDNKVQEDITTFVNDSLPAISEDRDNAIAVYNSYFTGEDVDIQQYLKDLQDTAIPDMETYITNVTAIETSTDEVAGLKDLYLQSVQKECDAMKMVASAIEEDNVEFLTQADTMMGEATSFMTQYQSQLKVLAIDNDITINGSFN